MKTFSILIALIGIATLSFSQSPAVKINPDTTQIVIPNSGNDSIQANPNGTYTVTYFNRNSTVQFNPDGTHKVIPTKHNLGCASHDGTHTVIQNHKNNSIQIKTNGPYTKMRLVGNDSTKAAQINTQPSMRVKYKTEKSKKEKGTSKNKE